MVCQFLLYSKVTQLYSTHFFVFFFFLGPHPWHMEVLRLGEGANWSNSCRPTATATATAMPYPSCICDLYHSSRQCRILNPLSEAKDRTCVLIDTNQICFHWAKMGTPKHPFLALFSLFILYNRQDWHSVCMYCYSYASCSCLVPIVIGLWLYPADC